MKMFEYLAAGRTIVTSDLPVIREVLNEQNAVFCDPNDVGNWKVEIEKLLADESRSELGKQALQDVSSYTWLARAEKIMQGFDLA
jgi:glycosyltransferase involved in cell wall biosynthesis